MKVRTEPVDKKSGYSIFGCSPHADGTYFEKKRNFTYFDVICWNCRQKNIFKEGIPFTIMNHLLVHKCSAVAST